MPSITLSQFITQVLATKKAVGNGQCGDLVDLYLVEVFNNHTSYDTALDYWTYGIPGFSRVTGTPLPGDIVCYNAHGVYTAGHIAIYVGNGEVFEQNADPDGSLPHTFARANTYLLGYLRNEGDNTTMNPTPAQAGATYAAFATEADGITPGDISQADLDTAIQTPWANWIPNFYPGVQTLRNDIGALTTERDTVLYPFVNAVCAALGLPDTVDTSATVNAINALKNGTVNKQEVINYITSNLN